MPILLLAVWLNWVQLPDEVQDKWVALVLHVIDGDTLDLFSAGSQFRVRLAAVDAPELYLSAGREAKRYAQGLEGKWVEVIPEGWDVYGRLVAWIKVPGHITSFNTELVLNGYARPYRTTSGVIFMAASWKAILALFLVMLFKVVVSLLKRRWKWRGEKNFRSGL